MRDYRIHQAGVSRAHVSDGVLLFRMDDWVRGMSSDQEMIRGARLRRSVSTGWRFGDVGGADAFLRDFEYFGFRCAWANEASAREALELARRGRTRGPQKKILQR